MAVLASIPFQIQRVALMGGVQQAVIAPQTCQSVTIGNITTGDLRIITDAQGVGYLIVASGFERVIWLPRQDSGQFRRGLIAFWLQADDTGEVTLTWA